MNEESDSNMKLVKVTFWANPSMVAHARRKANRDNRDLSSICRMALDAYLGINEAVVRGRGRPNGERHGA